jgi:hypothetical protein
MMQAACGHSFHVPCLRDHLKESNVCPVDQIEIDVQALTKKSKNQIELSDTLDNQ